MIMNKDDQPTCQVVSATDGYQGKQGLSYGAAISAESVGAKGICMHLVTIPPGGKANAHLHEGHETAMYVLSGEGGMWFGERLQQHVSVKAGEFLYIPAGVPHQPYNPSRSEATVAVLARTDPNEQESVTLLPELDGVHP
jgi:uncharacterized RmlC-like cupin family protein